MSAGNKWEHFILRGEFPERKKIVQGLTLEQVNNRPAEKMHTIYEELWHTTRWAHIVVNRDSEAEKKFTGKDVFPEKPAESQKQWDELVNEFGPVHEYVAPDTVVPDKLNVDPVVGVVGA